MFLTPQSQDILKETAQAQKQFFYSHDDKSFFLDKLL